jgi:hypothetical protein
MRRSRPVKRYRWIAGRPRIRIGNCRQGKVVIQPRRRSLVDRSFQGICHGNGLMPGLMRIWRAIQFVVNRTALSIRPNSSRQSPRISCGIAHRIFNSQTCMPEMKHIRDSKQLFLSNEAWAWYKVVSTRTVDCVAVDGTTTATPDHDITHHHLGTLFGRG